VDGVMPQSLLSIRNNGKYTLVRRLEGPRGGLDAVGNRIVPSVTLLGYEPLS